MHPAFSVIFFTVSSGAGYGLLFVLAVLAACGVIVPDFWLGFVGFGLSFALITAGLLSSTFHLGHPERAWRAVSQWRSSWLSREGVMALATYLPAGILALVFTFGEPNATVLAILGALTAICSVLTVFTTGMIYRSLRPIHAWCNRWVVPGYLVLGAGTGLLLAQALLSAFASDRQDAVRVIGIVTIAALAVAIYVKRAYWRFIDSTPAASTPESATGLGSLGKVKLLESPHTQDNYLMKEMGYRVARKHALKLRQLAQSFGMVTPIVLTIVGLLLPPLGMLLLAIPAAALGLLGVAIERWLFFAQAKHTVMLYYGAADA